MCNFLCVFNRAKRPAFGCIDHEQYSNLYTFWSLCSREISKWGGFAAGLGSLYHKGSALPSYYLIPLPGRIPIICTSSGVPSNTCWWKKGMPLIPELLQRTTHKVASRCNAPVPAGLVNNLVQLGLLFKQIVDYILNNIVCSLYSYSLLESYSYIFRSTVVHYLVGPIP